MERIQAAVQQIGPRRLAAAGLALAVHGLMVLVILVLPRPAPPEDPPEALDLILVTEADLVPPVPDQEPEQEPDPPQEPEAGPTPEPEPEPELERDASPVPPDPPRTATDTPERDDEDDLSTDPPVSADARPGDAPAVFGGGGEPQPFPGGPGSTGWAVRDIFCLSTSDGNRDALNCPPSDGSEGLPMLQYADPENVAAAEAAFARLSEAQIRALFASGATLPVRDLSGQDTLADPTARSTSSSDQMRDTLPALVPDPAFGD